MQPWQGRPSANLRKKAIRENRSTNFHSFVKPNAGLQTELIVFNQMFERFVAECKQDAVSTKSSLTIIFFESRCLLLSCAAVQVFFQSPLLFFEYALGAVLRDTADTHSDTNPS